VSEEVLGNTQDIDESKVEAFAEQMLGVLNDAMLALMTSVGHQTGLFDTMADLPPSTSEEIASAAKLQERYVREWLGPMVVGGIATYDPSGKTYRLPPEHAACLTRAAGPTTLRTSRRSLRCSPMSRKASSRASATVAACRTPRLRVSRK
jgi:hypothetical protein